MGDEPGVPESLDLLKSENESHQVKLGGGLLWLDATCVDRYGSVYIDCTLLHQQEILDLIAYGKNVAVGGDRKFIVEGFRRKCRSFDSAEERFGQDYRTFLASRGYRVC